MAGQFPALHLHHFHIRHQPTRSKHGLSMRACADSGVCFMHPAGPWIEAFRDGEAEMRMRGGATSIPSFLVGEAIGWYFMLLLFSINHLLDSPHPRTKILRDLLTNPSFVPTVSFRWSCQCQFTVSSGCPTQTVRLTSCSSQHRDNQTAALYYSPSLIQDI